MNCLSVRVCLGTVGAFGNLVDAKRIGKCGQCLCGAEIKTDAPSDSWQCLIHCVSRFSEEFLFYFKKNLNDAKFPFENQQNAIKKKKGTQMKEIAL